MIYQVPAFRAISKVTTGTMRSLRCGESGEQRKSPAFTYIEDETQGKSSSCLVFHPHKSHYVD